jgi:arylsulfatase
LGVADDTLVVFLADNGGCAEFLSEDGQKAREWPTTRDGRPVRFGNDPAVPPGGPDTYQSYELPWAGVSNAPFRLYKSWVHEGGISTPLIVRWPRGGMKNTVNHEPLHLVDFLPTCLELTGAAHPREFNGRAIQPPAGESFLPALSGRPWHRRQPIFFEHQGNRAVRDGQWKLVNRHPGEFELYNMTEDRTELHDLAAKDPDRVSRMKKMYDEFAARCGVLPWAKVRELQRRPLKTKPDP